MIPEEDILIEGCKKGVRSAQKVVYAHYRAVLYSICLRYLKDKEEAQDMVQEVFIHIFSKIHQFKGQGSFEGWLKRITVNECIYHLRKKTKFSEALMEEVPDVAEESEEDSYSFSWEQLLQALNSIPQPYAVVFSMFVIDEYSHKEIAGQLNIPEITCRTRLRRARLMLQEKLKKMTDGQS